VLKPPHCSFFLDEATETGRVGALPYDEPWELEIMTVAALSHEQDVFKLENPVRIVTAASLFDGHDAAIQIMRRLLQSMGAEVIHLGHDRSVQEVVRAAIHEDAQAIAVSSYQGGHVEYFTYMRELLRQKGADHIHIFGGGGGVIVPEEIATLEEHQVRIFSPEDGRQMGLVGMIQSLLETSDHLPGTLIQELPESLDPEKPHLLPRVISSLELGGASAQAQRLREQIQDRLAAKKSCPVLGITGTGGAGKSSLIDEILNRFLSAFPKKRIGVLSVDPSRRKSGGALLGDRIRMNSAKDERVFVRSMATRRAHSSTSDSVKDALEAMRAAQFDLIVLETAGIGQSDSEVSDLADLSIYVMSPEFGAPSQLEKIDMLDFADLVVINKFDKRGAEDALREVRKTVQRNRELFHADPASMPVYGTTAHRFQDPGTNAFFNALCGTLQERFGKEKWKLDLLPEGTTQTDGFIPPGRAGYLGEIANTIRAYHQDVENDMKRASVADGCRRVLAHSDVELPEKGELIPEEPNGEYQSLIQKHNGLLCELAPERQEALRHIDAIRSAYQQETQSYTVRNKEIVVQNHVTSLSHQPIPKVAVPVNRDWEEQVRFLGKENFPGSFPFTNGVFPFKRAGEDPARMFAGEGSPERTNQRFHYLSAGQPAARLSTAFDSVTLYGADPDLRPDIFGKIGNAGVSVSCLDDAKRLYSGFDLCVPTTSVSMTINGPAPTILAFFLNTAIDAACERKLKVDGRWEETEKKIHAYFEGRGLERPTYRGDLPEGHDGHGLGFLGLTADQVMDPKEYQQVKSDVLQKVRGTVQADILKEDQAQNTCIFSTEFALRMMGDVQEFFVTNQIKNFYSVSVSGYHIAEAGANPITQLAFTLANGFTLAEYYRSRGMDVNDFAPNFSFFFSNGLDPEYAVIGRVARRIWAIAMRDKYNGNARSQKLKYHIQTSGRSLHAQEIAFNDIRTTLQALYAIVDNCNSLHTNAYDEAITTPTEESVRRALAIQLIINRELGLSVNENVWQGSYFIEYLTDLVEEAVLKEFEALNDRGGVLGAMETMYQRSRIQDESMLYEQKKHNGDLPIVGVNTFLPDNDESIVPEVELTRSTDDEKQQQVKQIQYLDGSFKPEKEAALARLRQVAQSGGNIFEELMETSKFCSLGTISGTLFEAGGAYRRSM
jgi:isobutyryl-CoA mutase